MNRTALQHWEEVLLVSEMYLNKAVVVKEYWKEAVVVGWYLKEAVEVKEYLKEAVELEEYLKEAVELEEYLKDPAFQNYQQLENNLKEMVKGVTQLKGWKYHFLLMYEKAP